MPPSNAGDIHSGTGSVVFQFTGGTKEATLFQAVPTVEGCCYDFQFWAKGSPGSGSLTASVSFRDNMSNILATTSVTVDGGSLDTSAWGTYRLITPPAPMGTVDALVLFDVTGNGKSLRLDDVILASSGCS